MIGALLAILWALSSAWLPAQPVFVLGHRIAVDDQGAVAADFHDDLGFTKRVRKHDEHERVEREHSGANGDPGFSISTANPRFRWFAAGMVLQLIGLTLGLYAKKRSSSFIVPAVALYSGFAIVCVTVILEASGR